MKRVIILRHGEEPNTKKYDETTIGLNNQGAVRTLLMPELVQKILGTDYECHTYTNTIKGQPTSRSYYTSQLLNNKISVYNKSSDINTLINNVKKSTNNNIIICWKHDKIPDIIDKLIGKQKINYKNVISDIQKNLNNYKLIGTKKINTNDLIQIKYCSDNFTENNKNVRTNFISNNDDLGYSLVWDININTKTYTVYPGYLVLHDNDNSFLIEQYV